MEKKQKPQGDERQRFLCILSVYFYSNGDTPTNVFGMCFFIGKLLP